MAARIQIGEDRDVEDDLTVTWTLQEGEGYTVSAEQASASVVLEESEVPEFSVSVSPTAIAEGESATVTVAITNGIRFREDQTINLTVSGTASGSDYSGVPVTPTLAAETYSATTTLTAAVADQEQEEAETVTITASHGGTQIGSATVTIAASAAAPPLTAEFVGLPATHDGETAFAFDLRFSEEIEIMNRIEDLWPLAGLEALDLRGNPAGSLRPLRGLGSLAWVHVGGSGIGDLGPLEGLSGLTVPSRQASAELAPAWQRRRRKRARPGGRERKHGRRAT